MKCKKENIDKLLGLTIWCLNECNRPMQGRITNALYDDTRNNVIVTIEPAIIHEGNSETIRYLRQCYEEFDELWDHAVDFYDADLQKITNKIKDELKYEIFSGENGRDLTFRAMYILLDYYANKQIKQYDEKVIFGRIRDLIIPYIDKSIDKICEDIK